MKLAALLLAALLGGEPLGAGAAGDTAAVPAYQAGPRAMVVKATAYTSGPESTGKRPGHPAYGLTATGHRALEGHTIAVDPRKIPLGSRVFITELGEYRYAEDTGGAIRGERIDLYMDEVPKALRWGIRDLHITVEPKI